VGSLNVLGGSNHYFIGFIQAKFVRDFLCLIYFNVVKAKHPNVYNSLTFIKKIKEKWT